MAIPRITFPDKQQGQNPETDHDTQLWFGDVNQLKTTANETADFVEQTRQPFYDITNITSVPSPNSNPTVRERLWWAINSITPSIQYNNKIHPVTIYSVSENDGTIKTYLDKYELRQQGTGNYGHLQPNFPISQLNPFGAPILLNEVTLSDTNDDGIASIINNGTTVYNVSQNPVFEVDVNGVITKYIWDLDNAKEQTLIGGTNPDVVIADFIPIGNAISTSELEIQLEKINIKKVNSISELRNITIPASIVLVLGYHTPEDGGGGHFSWSPNDTTLDDGGYNIKLASKQSGRYKRITETSEVNVKYFGAKSYIGVISNSVNFDDSTDAFNKALNYLPKTGSLSGWGIGTIYIPKGNYLINGQINRASPIGLIYKGDSQYATSITRTVDTGVMFPLRTYINVEFRDISFHHVTSTDQNTWTNVLFELDGQGGGRNFVLKNISTYNFSRVIHHTNSINEDTTYIDRCTFISCHTFLESENSQAVINEYKNFTLGGNIQRGFYIAGNQHSLIQNLNWVIDGTLIEYKNVNERFNTRGLTLINCKGEFSTAHSVVNTAPKLIKAVGSFINSNITFIDCSLIGGPAPHQDTVLFEVDGASVSWSFLGGTLNSKPKIVQSTINVPRRGNFISFKNTKIEFSPDQWFITDTGAGGATICPITFENVKLTNENPINLTINKIGTSYLNTKYSIGVCRENEAVASFFGGSIIDFSLLLYGQNTIFSKLQWIMQFGAAGAGKTITIYTDALKTNQLAQLAIPNTDSGVNVYDITFNKQTIVTEGLFVEVDTPTGVSTHRGYLMCNYENI